MTARLKEGPLGESNTALTARLYGKECENAERKGLGHMLARLQAEADEFDRRTARKGVCPECFMERSCGIDRGKHECW